MHLFSPRSTSFVIKWAWISLSWVLLETRAEPNLPFGDVNLVVLTDVHSWVGGHGSNEPQWDADYGDVVSFYERLKLYCDSTQKDLWFVMNGDWIDGTGLSLDGDSSHLIPLLEKMPWDVVNTGNHELYKANVIDYMKRPGGFIDWWGSRHLSSNIIMSDTSQPLSNLYSVLRGINSDVLVFGFLYNLPDPSTRVTVEHVAEVVQQSWFQHVLTKESYDVILVMAHMGTDDPSVTVLRDAIRKFTGDSMPIQFITGHTHLRRFGIVDHLSTSVEAGRYLDTVGFVSFPNQVTAQLAGVNATNLFRHVFLDANVEILKQTLGNDEFTTPFGQEVGAFIERTRSTLGLDEKLGCAPQDYFMNRSMEADDSLWRIYKEEVVPTQLELGSPVNRAIIISQASWRYDLFHGSALYDDIVAVSPFNEPIYFLGSFAGSDILQLHTTLNKNNKPWFNALPSFILSGTVDPNKPSELYTHHFELESIKLALAESHPEIVVDPATTNLTSTSIWTNFVLDQWPCPGESRVHIPRLNGDAHDSTAKADGPSRFVVAVTIIFCAIFFCGGAFTCWVVMAQLCCGSSTFENELIDTQEEQEDMLEEFP